MPFQGTYWSRLWAQWRSDTGRNCGWLLSKILGFPQLVLLALATGGCLVLYARFAHKGWNELGEAVYLAFAPLLIVVAGCLAFAVGAGVWNVFLSPSILFLRAKEAFDSQVDQVRETQSKLDQLLEDVERLKEPKLEIVFLPHQPPFVQRAEVPATTTGGFEWQEWRFRIGIQNMSEATIENLEVTIFAPFIVFGPVPLQRMHDDPPEGTAFKTSHTLNPRDIMHFDLFAVHNGWKAKTDEIILLYAKRNIPNTIPRRPTKIRVRVTGRDVIPKESIASISFVEKRKKQTPLLEIQES